MASVLLVDKLDPQSGTALEIGTSGDTVTVPSGATLTLTNATLNLPTTITSTTEVKTNKVSPGTGTAFALGDSGDTFTVPSGATIVNSGTATGFGINQTSFLPNANPLIINGNMQVAQRSTSVAGVTGTGYYTCDRWAYIEDSSATVTITQESMSEADENTTGFSTALKLDVTTADASLASGDYAVWRYNFEGQDLQLLNKGTAAAQTTTVSFWVKSTKTGTFIVDQYDNDNNRQCSKAYTVDTTDTWEKKIVAFPADTTGRLGNDNGNSFYMNFVLMAGSGYTSGTLQTTWATYAIADTWVGQVNAFDSTSNNFHITGVQLEVGTYTSSDLPPFRNESYGDNLARCHRYCVKFGGDSVYSTFCVGAATTTAELQGAVSLPVQMRTSAPSWSDYGTFRIFIDNATQTTTAMATATGECGNKSFHIKAQSLSMTAGQAGLLTANNSLSTYFIVDTEL